MANNVAPTVSNLTCSNPRDGAEGHQVPLPPPFGAKQTWQVCRHQWVEFDISHPGELASANIGIARECLLDEKHHSAYWECVEHILLTREGYAAAKLPPP